MPNKFTPREFIEKINSESTGPAFDPYGVEGLMRRQQEGSATSDLLSEAKARVEGERVKNTPEGQIAELEQQIEDMRQWLIQNAAYYSSEVDDIIQNLSVEYNPEKQQAEVIGDLNLYLVAFASGLKLPQSIRGWLDLARLTSAKGLELPKSIGGNLILKSLTSAEHLELPQSIDGYLDLTGLTSAEHLELPQSIGGSLWLNKLTSAEGLELPKNIDGIINLAGLTPAEREQIRAQRPDLAERIFPLD